MLGDERGLAWCGGSSARGFKVRVLRWRSGVAGALLRRGAAGAAGGAIGDLGALRALGGARGRSLIFSVQCAA
ncbi:MAG: hypothetical protein PUB55_06730 [Bacteroidales bacterium]|nr:hypothetical protein [Bacteroidales bacterium]